MPRPQWRPVEELSQFARLVREGYMWAQTPNLSVSDLAARTGISKQTIWSWLNHNATPRRATIVQLAEHTELDLDELLEAAGLPSTEELREQERAKVAEMRRYNELFIRELLASPAISDATKDDLRRNIHLIISQPEQYLASLNTYREWNAPSPAEFEAQRATEQVDVFEPEPITTPEQAHGQMQRRQRPRRHPDDEPTHLNRPSRPTGA